MTDDRDRTDKVEEDLTEGPTPEIRRRSGEPDLEHDTSEGPTPETRRADREAEERGETRK